MAHNSYRDQFNINNSLCSKDILDLNIPAHIVDNFELKLNRFAQQAYDDSRPDRNPFYFFKANRKGQDYVTIPNFGRFDFVGLKNRTSRQAEDILGENNFETLVLKPDCRLVAGLGSASVYETSIYLHHIYGIPYLPASSIKGIVRSWVIQSVFFPEKVEGQSENELRQIAKDAEEKAMSDPDFSRIFGCTRNDKPGNQARKARQGSVVFWDAFPIQKPGIEDIKTDVLNPHYNRYYSKGKPPVDTDKPIPVYFLTVAHTPFHFIFGSKELGWKDWAIRGKTFTQYYKEALIDRGIGAKTAIGYGYFREV